MASPLYRRNLKKWLFSPISLVALFLLVVLSGRGVYKVYQKERLSAQYLLSVENNLDRVKEREAELTKSVEYLKTSEGIEAEFRTKFRVVKEGEEVAVIINEQKPPSADLQAAVPVSWWGRIKGLFGADGK